MEELLDGDWLRHDKRCIIDSGDVRTPFPFHANLFGRPVDVVEECLAGLWEASLGRMRTADPPLTFAQWIEVNFGAGVYRHFMAPYNTKMWNVAPTEMGCDWIQDFIPSVEAARRPRTCRCAASR